MYKHAFERYRLQQGLLRSQHKTSQSFKTSRRQRLKAPKKASKTALKTASTTTKQQSWRKITRATSQKREAIRREEGSELITY